MQKDFSIGEQIDRFIAIQPNQDWVLQQEGSSNGRIICRLNQTFSLDERIKHFRKIIPIAKEVLETLLTDKEKEVSTILGKMSARECTNKIVTLLFKKQHSLKDTILTLSITSSSSRFKEIDDIFYEELLYTFPEDVQEAFLELDRDLEEEEYLKDEITTKMEVLKLESNQTCTESSSESEKEEDDEAEYDLSIKKRMGSLKEKSTLKKNTMHSDIESIIFDEKTGISEIMKQNGLELSISDPVQNQQILAQEIEKMLKSLLKTITFRDDNYLDVINFWSNPTNLRTFHFAMLYAQKLAEETLKSVIEKVKEQNLHPMQILKNDISLLKNIFLITSVYHHGRGCGHLYTSFDQTTVAQQIPYKFSFTKAYQSYVSEFFKPASMLFGWRNFYNDFCTKCLIILQDPPTDSLAIELAKISTYLQRDDESSKDFFLKINLYKSYVPSDK